MPSIPLQVGVGQSINDGTAGQVRGPSLNFAQVSPSGPLPQEKLNFVSPVQQHTLLMYPADIPLYYMSLPIHDYSRESWRSVGKLNEIARIILPLPREMIDNHNVRYQLEELGIGGAVGFDTIASGANAEASLGKAAVGVAQAGANAVRNSLGAAGTVAGKAFNGALGAAGLAVNDFMTVMLKGPEYKKRDFMWRFSPKTAAESETLRKIIQMINNSMAPSLFGPGSTFFSWPKIWKPEFVVYANADLGLNTFKMKPSVVLDASFNYTPQGVWSAYGSTKKPESIDFRLSMMELEFWLAGNFNDTPSDTPGATTSDKLNRLFGSTPNETPTNGSPGDANNPIL